MSTRHPLAEKLRPKTLTDFFGHPSITAEGGLIKASIASQRPLSLLLWGPPGTGKTTLAKIYMESFDTHRFSFHPATHGIADIKKLMQDRMNHPLLSSKPLMVFIDEIHRLSKAQQDAFLPFIENGELIAVAATTENPSFCLTSALLSRLRVITLSHHSKENLKNILMRAISQIGTVSLQDEVIEYLIAASDGDARAMLNMLEVLIQHSAPEMIDISQIQTILQKKLPYYDRDGESHYNMISALHKAVRGSDPNAALYWLCRMLHAGEDPRFLARRIIRIAVEDVGLADPEALTQATDAASCYERLGSPEGELALAQAVVYLSLSPKSNAIYAAFNKAKELAEKTSQLPPPPHICNAPTKMMKDLGYGRGYIYDHDTPEGFAGQDFLPKEINGAVFYEPKMRGFEREMKKRIDYFSALRKNLHKKNKVI